LGKQFINGKTMMRFILIAWLSFCSINNTYATEGGGGAYGNGGDGFSAGMLPPPGTYFLNYVAYYGARSFKDRNGNDTIPDFKIDAACDALRLLHMTQYQLLKGTWGMQLIVPFVNIDLTMLGKSQSKSGLGDIVVDPFIWAFHSKNFHYGVAMDITVPTGSYDKNDMANIGRNNWIFEPIIGFTYLTDSGYEGSLKLMYDFNTKNTDTSYLSGQEFHIDYTVAKKINAFTFGMGGYYYKQITSDEFRGLSVGTDGNRGQLFGIGPQVKYDYQKVSFALKYQHENYAENKPEGNKIWFYLLCAF